MKKASRSWSVTAVPPPVPTRPNALVSAATRVRLDGSKGGGAHALTTSEWAVEGWRFYDLVGELRYAANWLGNAMSRCRLTVAEVSEAGEVLGETEDQRVQDILAGLIGSPGRQAELLSTIGVHLTVPGDCFLLAELGEGVLDEEGAGAFSTWTVLSTEEIKTGGGGGIRVDRGDGNPRDVSLEEALLIRMWRPHPRRRHEADSPTRAVLPVLRELEALNRHLLATVDSRLAGNGILMLPSEMSFPAPRLPGQTGGEDPFMESLTEAMVTPIQDPGTASAVVPIVVRANAEAIAAAKWLSFAATLTAEVEVLRKDAIRRLALGMDMPPEVLLGISDSNNWNAWQIDAQSVKLHVEPAMMLVCSALTEGYLRPALEVEGLDPTRYAIWFDSADLRQRPNRTEDALQLFDRGQLSAEALRREMGFEEDDAPEMADPAITLALELLKGAPSLAQEPGLGVLVEQIRAALAGDTPEQMPEDAMPADPVPEGGTGGGDEGMPPQDPGTVPSDGIAPAA